MIAGVPPRLPTFADLKSELLEPLAPAWGDLRHPAAAHAPRHPFAPSLAPRQGPEGGGGVIFAIPERTPGTALDE